MLLIQWSQRCSIQPSGHSVTVHVYRLLMRPWAMHWTQAAPEASLLLTMSSDPLGVWTCLRGICKEFLITLYVWGALNSCVKLHRLVHLKTHHASASGTPNQSRAAQVYQGDTSALHIVFIFSTLWLPKFDLLSVFWGLAVWKIHACIHTLEGFVFYCFFPWTLGAFNKNIS